jgi:hypothetical protein
MCITDKIVGRTVSPAYHVTSSVIDPDLGFSCSLANEGRGQCTLEKTLVLLQLAQSLDKLLNFSVSQILCRSVGDTNELGLALYNIVII